MDAKEILNPQRLMIAVGVLVIDWIRIGFEDPITTPPTSTLYVSRLLIINGIIVNSYTCWQKERKY